jgi:Protein of unknown function (DUF4240)
MNTFWSLISLVGGYPPADEHSSFKRLEDALVIRGAEEIVAFADLLAEQLYRLDMARLASMPAVNTGIEQSNDTFLYNRCAVVIAGKDAVERVLSDAIDFVPFTDSSASSSEALLYVAEEAYEQATGLEWEHSTPHSYETGTNPDGWN